jgi:hypothetical protein
MTANATDTTAIRCMGYAAMRLGPFCRADGGSHLGVEPETAKQAE